MKLLDRDTNKDDIIAYLKAPEDRLPALTEKQHELLGYYFNAYTIRRNYTSMPDAINVLIRMSKQAGKVISNSTARRYIVEAQDIFGNTSKVSKEAALHYGLSVIEDAIAMAREMGDAKTMILGAKEYMEKAAKEDAELFNPEMLQQHIIEIVGDERATKILEQLTKKGSIDLDTVAGVMSKMAQDAEIVE
jgi:hypothetical protein